MPRIDDEILQKEILQSVLCHAKKCEDKALKMIRIKWDNYGSVNGLTVEYKLFKKKVFSRDKTK